MPLSLYRPRYLNEEKTFIQENSFDEYVEVIRNHYPQIASALEITKTTFKMLDIELKHQHYPSFALTYYQKEGFLQMMIDFSVGCSFFVKKTKLGEPDIFFSVYTPEGFDYPEKLTLDNVEEWMFHIVYQNYIYEEKNEDR